MPSKHLRPSFKNRKPKTYDVLLGLNEVYIDNCKSLQNLDGKPIFTDVYVAKQLQFTVLSVIQFEDHRSSDLKLYRTKVYLPTQTRFPIGGEHVTCHEPKLTSSLGKQQISIRTTT